MILLLVPLLVSNVIVISLHPIDACETKFVHVFNESAFYFNESFLGTFEEAVEYCESLGSSLASIHSHEENDFINHHLGFVKAWIGLRRVERNGSFSWVDSTSFDYNRTLPKNLNNNYECPKSCCIYHTVLTRFFNRFGTYVEIWKEGSCHRQLGAICRRPVTQHDFNLVPSSCDQHFNHVHSGLTYHFDPSLNMTFKSAQSYCKSLGSSLPTIQTMAQNEYLQFLVRNTEVWLASTEVVAGENVSFSWSDGSSMNWTNFAEKSNKAACNYFKCRGFINRAGKWSGISIFAHLGVVCQKSVSDEDDHSVSSRDEEEYSVLSNSDPHSSDGRTTVPSCCPAVFPHSWNGKRYHFNPTMKGSLNQSLNYCKSLGSTMATIESGEENDFIHSITKESKVWLPAKANSLQQPRFQSWFTNGDAINYTKWYRTESLCATGCCGIFLDMDNTWMSDECSSSHHVVCVKESSECTISSSSECDDLFTNSFRGKSYYHVKGLSKTWNESKSFCNELQSDLVTITSKKQNSFLTNMISKQVGSVWLSAEKRQFLSYFWPSGDSLVYNNWGSSAPSCTDSCCGIVLNPSDHGTWFDVTCTENLGIICERDTRSMIGLLTSNSNRESREESTTSRTGSYNNGGNNNDEKETPIPFHESSPPEIIAKIAVLESKIHKIQEEVTSKFNFFLEGSKKSEDTIQILHTNLAKLMNRLKVMREEEEMLEKEGSEKKEEKKEEEKKGKEKKETEKKEKEKKNLQGESIHDEDKDERRKRELSEKETTSSLYQNYYIYAGTGSIVLFILSVLVARCITNRPLFSIRPFDDLPVVRKATLGCDNHDTSVGTPPTMTPSSSSASFRSADTSSVNGGSRCTPIMTRYHQNVRTPTMTNVKMYGEHF